jgi:hypothetical protein
LERNIIDNICHQYWHDIVANNGFEEAWLSEGISNYLTGKIIESSYDKNNGFFRIADGIPLSGFPLITFDNFPLVAYIGEVNTTPSGLSKVGYMINPTTDPIFKFGWKYKNKQAYMACSRYKPDLMLRTLENHIGQSQMLNIMKGFFEQYKYSHPKTIDFVKFVEKSINKDMSWFFDPIIYGTDLLDYAVTGISNITEDYRNRVDIELSRVGTVKFPVELRIILEDGSKIDDIWNGEEKWIKKTYFTGSPAIYAVLDPNHKIFLDANTSNNSKMTIIKWSPVLKWVGQWLFWMQAFLQIISSIC